MEITKLTTKLTSRTISRIYVERLWFAYDIGNSLQDLIFLVIEELY